MKNRPLSRIAGLCRWYLAHWRAAPAAVLLPGLLSLGAGFLQLLQPDVINNLRVVAGKIQFIL